MATTDKQGSKQGKGTSTRGFASMDPARQRAIASEGGKAAHQRGTAHEFTSEEARKAGSLSHGNRQSANRSNAPKPEEGEPHSSDKMSQAQKKPS